MNDDTNSKSWEDTMTVTCRKCGTVTTIPDRVTECPMCKSKEVYICHN